MAAPIPDDAPVTRTVGGIVSLLSASALFNDGCTVRTGYLMRPGRVLDRAHERLALPNRWKFGGSRLLRGTALVACSGALGWPIVFYRGLCGWGRSSGSAQSRRNDMQSTVLCSQCDLPEGACKCDRYCCYCQGQQSVRLCMDGKYYCPDCREACEISVAQSHAQPND
jgi:hypothetical protein